MNPWADDYNFLKHFCFGPIEIMKDGQTFKNSSKAILLILKFMPRYDWDFHFGVINLEHN